MKCTIPEISWHNRDPVLSVDFQLSEDGVQRLATGGSDSHVLIWHVLLAENGKVSLDFASDLRRHTKAVNVVRFSPAGDILASGDDEAAIWIWKKVDKDPSAMDIFNDDDDKEVNKEHWGGVRTLRGHLEDICDLCWSSDGNCIVSGSVDNSAILWDVHKGQKMKILSDHKGFVQGVTWDPKSHYVATLCSDRSCRIYNIASGKTMHNVQKAVLPISGAKDSPTSEAPGRPVRLFHDDTLKSFCRRLTFTPDGELLIAPSGLIESKEGDHQNVTYIFSRIALNKPVLYLPSKDKYTVAVKCCPMLFLLRNNVAESPVGLSAGETATVFKLPYRIIFAVATQDSVLLYDTQQSMPFGWVSNIHYTRLTDLSWTKDGRLLIVSSTDGYCSIISFEEGELGIPYHVEKDASQLANPSPSESSLVSSPSLTTSPEEKSPRMNESADNLSKTPDTMESCSSEKRKRRVPLITLFSPKSMANKSQRNSHTSTSKSAEPKMKTKLEYPVDDESIKQDTKSILPAETTVVKDSESELPDISAMEVSEKCDESLQKQKAVLMETENPAVSVDDKMLSSENTESLKTGSEPVDGCGRQMTPEKINGESSKETEVLKLEEPSMSDSHLTTSSFKENMSALPDPKIGLDANRDLNPEALVEADPSNNCQKMEEIIPGDTRQTVSKESNVEQSDQHSGEKTANKAQFSSERKAAEPEASKKKETDLDKQNADIGHQQEEPTHPDSKASVDSTPKNEATSVLEKTIPKPSPCVVRPPRRIQLITLSTSKKPLPPPTET